MTDSSAPFARKESVDTPGIVGAQWWHEGLAFNSPISRRAAVQALLIGGGVLAFGAVVSKACAPDSTTASRGALDVQKEYGWDFAARGEPMTFDGALVQPFDRPSLASLATDLAPVRVELRPYFVPTLLQSATASPRTSIAGEWTPFIPLSGVLRPVFTPKMDAAYRRGKALAGLFERSAPGVAVIVDLPGPESVAFAAGAAAQFDTVFAIDNWPHPKGVVPAHLTLAAAAYYQPLFMKAAYSRPSSAPPLFVLDRSRLAPYSDEGTQFDNRHLARIPSAAKLAELGIKRLLYVAPTVSDTLELDDLNDDFVYDARMNVVIKIVGADAFGPDVTEPLASPTPPASSSTHGASASSSSRSASSKAHASSSSATTPPAPPSRVASSDEQDKGPTMYYGSARVWNDAFWVDYPWSVPPATGARPIQVPAGGRDYVPHARVTQFSSGSPAGASTRTTPARFGTVQVLIASATGAILGAAFSRNGSWSRSSGGWGG